MRIVDIRQTTITLGAAIRNAEIRFDAMTASAVAIVTDKTAGGRALTGFGFDSIGRYGHGALLHERFAPRLLAADPASYDDGTGGIDPLKCWRIVMRNEKPGGHGERAGAVGLLDAALWDLAAKAEDKPLWAVLAERFNAGRAPARVTVYGSGGHYRDGDDGTALAAELESYKARGHTRFKIKIGGLSWDEDRRRLEAALRIVGEGKRLAVDGNGTFAPAKAFDLAHKLAEYGLAWFEEPLDPLDYETHRELAAIARLPIATGENCFSLADTRNLLRYAGLKPGRDLLQMDISLSYGVPEYLGIVDLLATSGWPRGALVPHAGHLFSFHCVAGLGLGLHEAAPDETSLFGGYPAGVHVEDGAVTPWDAPGAGFERKANLWAVLEKLAG